MAAMELSGKDEEMFGLLLAFGVGVIVGMLTMSFACIAKQGDEAARKMAAEALGSVDLSDLE